MSQSIEFAKLSGSGNDFICIDDRDGRLDDVLASPRRAGHFARTLCCRGMGIGADGLLLARRPEIEEVCDVAATFLEADGSESELCGNGTACFVRCMIELGLDVQEDMRILTPAGVVRAQKADGDYIRVCIPSPEDMQQDLDVTAAGRRFRCDYVVTGVPHLITYVGDLEKVDMGHWGPALRHHRQFAPRGVNANFVQVLGEGRIALRTFEFGVEDETLACGTGSAAAAILTAMRYHWGEEYFRQERPVLVTARSGDELRVYFNRDENGLIDDVCLETVVRFLYTGKVHGDLARRALAVPAPARRPVPES